MQIDTQVYLNDLIDWLSIPSISGDPAYKEDMEKAADWLIKKLTAIGFEAKTMPTSLHPVVYGELLAGSDQPLARTILIYGHYDVQSPEPLDEWKSEPFKPEIRDGNLYARGVADDKGQLYTWVAALDHMVKDKADLPFNIKILVEGAEEEGSEGLAEFVAEHKELLAADVCVLSDSHSLSPTQPLITYGLRGLAYFEITLSVLNQDAHSGIYGGNVRNAANELASLIAKMKDDSGKILIPGFYDSVRDLEAEEVKELQAFPWTETEIQKETGVSKVFGETGYSIAARAGARPTLDVNGIWGGYQGEGGKTIIPAKASAKISMRLVPNQDPDEIAKSFESFVRAHVPEDIHLDIKALHTAEPVLLERTSSYFKAAESAFETVFGNKPVYELSGGSIGVVADFKNILGIDSVMFGYGLPDDGLHAPNEKLSLEMFEKGIQTNLEFFKQLSS